MYIRRHVDSVRIDMKLAVKMKELCVGHHLLPTSLEERPKEHHFE